jgi:fumarylacetoacetate (FAA) hydrolase
MKLATYRDGSRDGQLVVVSRDLGSAHYANGIASRLQQVLDDWNFLSPQLQDLYASLNQGRARHAFDFDPRRCMAPLPRAYQRALAAAYSAQGGEDEPPWRYAASDALQGPCDDIVALAEAGGLDFGAGLAVVTGDIAPGSTPEQALEGVRLLLLANDLHLREREAGRAQTQPASAYGPVAVTPDELGAAWQGGRVQLTLQVQCNGRKFGLLDTGADMRWHFGQLLADLAALRGLRAGSLLGAGTVTNADASRGHASIDDKRRHEAVTDGAPKTPFLAVGDRLRVEAKGRDGHSVFGAIEQRVVALHGEPAAEADAAPAADMPPDASGGDADHTSTDTSADTPAPSGADR